MKNLAKKKLDKKLKPLDALVKFLVKELKSSVSNRRFLSYITLLIFLRGFFSPFSRPIFKSTFSLNLYFNTSVLVFVFTIKIILHFNYMFSVKYL